MNEHRLGIIGGMGPQATNTFYQYIIDRTDAHSDQEHLSVLIFSDSDMPDRTGAILGSETDRAAVSQRLLDDARLLEAVSVFAIASTAIAFLPKVAATPRRAVANGACALALASCFGWWIGTYDIEEAYACTVDVWGVKESYAEQAVINIASGKYIGSFIVTSSTSITSPSSLNSG